MKDIDSTTINEARMNIMKDTYASTTGMLKEATTEQILSSTVQYDEPYGFLKTESNWDSHRPFLLLALRITEGWVTELGSGEGSTPYLRKYCEDHKRTFNSYEANQDWAAKMGSYYVLDWAATAYIWQQPCGLLFIDESPGEHRAKSIHAMADRADVIVIHDTELNGAGDYKFEPLWSLFKYVIHYNRTGGGAGATMVSNKIDLNRFKGCEFGGRVIE